MANKQTGVKPKKKNGKAVKEVSQKPQLPKFKTRVFDPSEMKKVRVNDKTVLEVDKKRDDAEVIANWNKKYGNVLGGFKKDRI